MAFRIAPSVPEDELKGIQSWTTPSVQQISCHLHVFGAVQRK